MMKNRMLSLLAVLVLVVSAPVWAQTLDEPPVPQEQENQATQTPVEAEIPEYTEEASADRDEDIELPKTAGLSPLMALLGIASGAGALALRRRR